MDDNCDFPDMRAGDKAGLPAQLHQEFVPRAGRQEDSPLSYHGRAAVDIVFVHGLASKYETTWAYKRKDGTRYHWMREQLPRDFPDARILGFEYPSRWYKDPVHTSLRECAAQLLHSLIRDRCDHDSNKMSRTRRTRPIIFIGHSFGGLVIKQAMALAGQVLRTNSPPTIYENHRDFLSAVSGIIFLGTPHRGTSFALLAGLQIWAGTKVLRVKGNGEVINILMPDSSTLNDLQKQFSQVYHDERMVGLQMVCFFEMRDISTPGWFSSGLSRVVFEDSAILDNAIARGMNADHMNMHNYHAGDSDVRDPNYDLLIGDLRMMVLGSQKIVPARFEKWVYGANLPDAEREQLQRWLGQPEARQAQQSLYDKNLKIQQSASYTCQWIHGTAEFRAWLSPQSEIDTLWISGLAGSGKSVLAAYIINYLRNSTDLAESPVVLHFFCGIDRISETTERMLSLLIHQLLISRPDSEELFELATKLYQTSLGFGVSIPNIAAALNSMACVVNEPLYIVIDNLEDIDNPTDFLEALADIRTAGSVRILISSQHTGAIAKTFSEKLNVEQPLLISDHSADDIGKFIDVQTKQLLRRNPILEHKGPIIHDSVSRGARSMFQWVNSALHHLEDVKDPADVDEVLSGIPPDLLTTYDKIFERLASQSDAVIARVKTCLKFLAVAATSVNCADIKMAFLVQDVLSRENSNDQDIRLLFDQATSQDRMQVAEREVLSYLKSLVDILPNGTLQFKHPTYLRALTRVPPINSVTKPGDIFKFRKEDAHLAVSSICMTICRVTIFTHVNAFAEWQVPLVQYAWAAWAYHLDRGEVEFKSPAELAQIRALVKSNPALEQSLNRTAAAQSLFDGMIDGVCKDALIYLDALIAFVVQPLKAVPGRFSDQEYVLSLMRAQESLGDAARELCALRRLSHESLASGLESVRAEVLQEMERPVPEQSLYTAMRRTKDEVRQAKTKLLGENSFVKKLRVDEYLQDNPRIARPGGAQKLFLELARILRTTALRVSVDPVYSALLATAGGSSFSPLHPFVYLAQMLEEAGVYPYWKTIAPGGDPMRPFICPASDREYPAAKFVLHCFEWRDPKKSELTDSSPTKTTGRYHIQYQIARPTTEPDDRPMPSRALTRVTTENWAQVQRLHEPKPEEYFSFLVKYRIFSNGDDSFTTKFIMNPMANMHMKYKLMARRYDANQELVNKLESGNIMFQDPVEVMAYFEPTEVRETQFKSWMRSVPAIINATFFQYVLLICEKFGELARRSFQLHFVRVELAWNDLNKSKDFYAFSKTYHTPATLQRHRVYAFLGFFLFCMRCFYFPTWGSFMWFHTWAQLPYAYRHGAVYLDLQNNYGFGSLVHNIFMYGIDYGIGALVISILKLEKSFREGILDEVDDESRKSLSIWLYFTGNRSCMSVAHVYAIFHCFCAVERSLFSFAIAAASIVACSRVIFYDVENVEAIFRFSTWFWVLIFIQLVIVGLQRAALEYSQNQANTLTVWRVIVLFIVFPLFNVLVYALFATYAVSIMGFLWTLAKPLRIVGSFVWNYVLMTSIVALRIGGTCAVLFVVYLAYCSMHDFAWDPYDTKGSVKKLLSISSEIHTTQKLPPAAFKRISEYPFGESKGVQKTAAATTMLGGPVPTLAEKVGQKVVTLEKALPKLLFGATQSTAVPAKSNGLAEQASMRTQNEPVKQPPLSLSAEDDEMTPEQMFVKFFGKVPAPLDFGIDRNKTPSLQSRYQDTLLNARDQVQGNLKEE